MSKIDMNIKYLKITFPSLMIDRWLYSLGKKNLQFFVPSIIYAIINNFDYILLSYMDPVTLPLFNSLKILSVTIFMRFLDIQWASLVLLIMGVCVYKTDDEKTILNVENEGIVLVFVRIFLVCIVMFTTNIL